MNIENITLLVSLLLLIQIFMPLTIETVFIKKIDLQYLFSPRDSIIEHSLFYKRGKRALANLLETLPLFILLILISTFKNVDNSNLAVLWVILRLIYVPLYIFGINYARTIIWVGSLVCLIFMAIKFL